MIRLATPADAPALAALHAEALPSSLLSALGRDVLDRYYRFAIEAETVLVAEDAGVIGGCVLCERPGEVLGRFVRAAPVAFARATAAALVRDRGLRARLVQRLRERGDEPHAPEVTQIFTDSRRRGQGIGASLLRTCEEILRDRGVRNYFVHTERDDNEAGIRFYRREGFVPVAESRSFGQAFLVMQKDLA